MTAYQAFHYLADLAAYAGGALGITLFVLRSRSGSWNSPEVRLCTALLFLVLGAGTLFRLFCSPLAEQRRLDLFFSALVVSFCVTAGAANIWRLMRTKHDTTGRT